jgi:hypothetical protein
MKPMCLISAALVIASCSVAQAQTVAPCSTVAHRAFDFWVGEWKVANAKGNEAGHSMVAKELGGCVITERWKSAGSNYEGMSINIFDPKNQTWTQDYVDNTGLHAVMTGRFEGKNLVYTRSFAGKDGKPTQTRMTFFPLDDDRVRQLVEQSTDNGKTWSTQYDLRYERLKATGM